MKGSSSDFERLNLEPRCVAHLKSEAHFLRRIPGPNTDLLKMVGSVPRTRCHSLFGEGPERPCSTG